MMGSKIYFISVAVVTFLLILFYSCREDSFGSDNVQDQVDQQLYSITFNLESYISVFDTMDLSGTKHFEGNRVSFESPNPKVLYYKKLLRI